MAIEGEYIVVGAPQIRGAPFVGGGFGRAFIFRRDDRGTPDDPLDDQWWEDAEFRTPDEIRDGDNFGSSVAISDGVVLIGKPGSVSSIAGSAYLYRNIDGVWRHVASVDPSDSRADDRFGAAVSLSGGVALVGALPPGGEFRSGAAYVFRETINGWVQEAKLIPSTESPFGLFGRSVSVAGEQAVVGGSTDLDAWPVVGTAYVFTAGKVPWSKESKLVGSDTNDLDSFGRAVATDGKKIVIGAPGKDSHLGAGYLFAHQADQWVEQHKLVASDRPSSGLLGASVALTGSYAFAGAAEAVYVYVVPSAAKTLQDFAVFQTCFGAWDNGLLGECATLDIVVDRRIDLRDFNEFLATFAGP